MSDPEIESLCKNIINSIFRYYHENQMDDKTEFFPLLKTLIESMINSNGNEKEKRRNNLIEYCMNNYIEIWLDQAETDCKNGFNKEEEIENAKKQFNIYYFEKRAKR